MKFDKKEIFKMLRDFSIRANALVELRKIGANYLAHHETLQLSLEQFIKSHNIKGFDPGIVRDGKGNAQYRRIENLAPELETFVNKLTFGM